MIPEKVYLLRLILKDRVGLEIHSHIRSRLAQEPYLDERR
jgi:hypothetical protein